MRMGFAIMFQFVVQIGFVFHQLFVHPSHRIAVLPAAAHFPESQVTGYVRQRFVGKVRFVLTLLHGLIDGDVIRP